MKTTKSILTILFPVVLFLIPFYTFGQNLEYHIRSGIADKNEYKKPASFNINFPDSSDSYYAIDAGITGTYVQPQSHFLFSEQSLTAELHKNTNIDKEQDLFALSISTKGVKGFARGFFSGLLLNNSADFSYKWNGIKDNNSFKVSYDLHPIWHQANISEVLFLESEQDSAAVGIYIEPEAGISYEDIVKSENDINGSISRTYQTLKIGIYPLYYWQGKKVIAVVSRTWWQTLDEDNFLTPEESKSPAIWDLSLAYYFNSNRTFGLKLNYIDGSDPSQNLLEQSHFKISFVVKK